jgi:hypothetical protein
MSAAGVLYRTHMASHVPHGLRGGTGEICQHDVIKACRQTNMCLLLFGNTLCAGQPRNVWFVKVTRDGTGCRMIHKNGSLVPCRKCWKQTYLHMPFTQMFVLAVRLQLGAVHVAVPGLWIKGQCHQGQAKLRNLTDATLLKTVLEV